METISPRTKTPLTQDKSTDIVGTDSVFLWDLRGLLGLDVGVGRKRMVGTMSGTERQSERPKDVSPVLTHRERGKDGGVCKCIYFVNVSYFRLNFVFVFVVR